MLPSASARSVALLSLVASPLLLTGCASKKETFKKEIAAWLKAHPTRLDYCTTLKIPNAIDQFTMGFGSLGFYKPASVFTDAGHHPILAIEKPGAKPSPALAALVKAGVIHAEPVAYTTYKETFDTPAGKVFGHNVFHYKTTTRTAYVLTNPAGWQTESGSFAIGPIPDSNTAEPHPAHHSYPIVPAGMNEMAPAFCGGTLTVKKVTQYTTPAPALGHIVSDATAVLALSGLPAWINTPAITPALGSPPKKEHQAKAAFEKTSNGWKLSGSVHSAGLYGQSLF